MLSVEGALARLLEGVEPLSVERVGLDSCLGRIAAEPMRAPTPVPPFTNSSMDGFAVRAGDLPGALRLVGEVSAGAERLPEVRAGTAVRIMTGAPLPRGADAVVPLELVTEGNGTIRVTDALSGTGAYVRQAGHDTMAGDQVLAEGDEMTPARIAVLASCGIGSVPVRRRPRVAILSTGDELTAPGEALRPGHIYDANTPALAAAVAETGAEPLVLCRVPDDERALEAEIRRGLAEADVLVCSGGVSVGGRDLVRGVLERVGELAFWRVNVQPGKPLAFGRALGRPVLGLPGNPVSALVTFELFGRPLLRALLRARGDGRLRVRAKLLERIEKDPTRRAYLRVAVNRATDGYEARPSGGQSSAQLRALAESNALLIVPEGEERGEPGRAYDAILTGTLA